MTARQIRFQDLPSLVGQEVGVSDWYRVTQQAVDAYAAATNDHQWFCEDVERAAKESPFGGTVAPGYFILALAPGLLKEIWYLQGARLGMNYGINRLRFPAPLRIGKRVRLRLSVRSVTPVADGQEVTLRLSFEVEGGKKPVCVAEPVYLDRYLDRYLG